MRIQSFSSGRYARYWIVGDERAGAGEQRQEAGLGDEALTEPVSSLQQRLEGWKEREAEEEEGRRRTINSGTGADIKSPWVREIKWAAHLGSRDMVKIGKAAVLPGPVRGAELGAEDGVSPAPA